MFFALELTVRSAAPVVGATFGNVYTPMNFTVESCLLTLKEWAAVPVVCSAIPSLAGRGRVQAVDASLRGKITAAVLNLAFIDITTLGQSADEVCTDVKLFITTTAVIHEALIDICAGGRRTLVVLTLEEVFRAAFAVIDQAFIDVGTRGVRTFVIYAVDKGCITTAAIVF